MNTITCDTCGKSSDIEGLINWFHLELRGTIVRSFGDGRWVDKDFCSGTCLKAWANGVH